MNTYLVPTTAAYCYEPYDHIFMVYAESAKEAYTNTYTKLQGQNIPLKQDSYESYSCELYLQEYTSTDPFHESRKYDILRTAFKNTKGMEYMAHFNVNWKDYTDMLARKAKEENWSNKTYPNNGILTNYLVHTYKKLRTDGQIIYRTNYALFNTGLFTKYYEPIYAYSNSEYNISFLTGHELNQHGISERPQKANYFKDPSLLLFDWHYPIDIHFKHILEDERNKERLPEGFLEKENKMCILTGAVELMKRRVSANYKLAIPQCYEDKIQLLLPLCLDTDEGKPNLALAVTKLDNCYQGFTCLTLDMAYNNARLIASPDIEWLTDTEIE